MFTGKNACAPLNRPLVALGRDGCFAFEKFVGVRGLDLDADGFDDDGFRRGGTRVFATAATNAKGFVELRDRHATPKVDHPQRAGGTMLGARAAMGAVDDCHANAFVKLRKPDAATFFLRHGQGTKRAGRADLRALVAIKFAEAVVEIEVRKKDAVGGVGAADDVALAVHDAERATRAGRGQTLGRTRAGRDNGGRGALCLFEPPRSNKGKEIHEKQWATSGNAKP